MKKKFKRELTFKLINKQLHKYYSYKLLLLLYVLFNFDFFLLKYTNIYKVTKNSYKLFKYYKRWKKKKISSLIISKKNKGKLKSPYLFLFFYFVWSPFVCWQFNFASRISYWNLNNSIKKLMFHCKLRKKVYLFELYFQRYNSTLGNFTRKGSISTYFRTTNEMKNFLNEYYKHLYLTTNYFNINKSLINLKNKIHYKNYKIKNYTVKKKFLKKKKKLIYFFLNDKKILASFYYNISINILTKKKNKITLIRSPFIYKKSREQFIRSYVMYLFKLEKLNFKTLYKITKKLKLIFNKNISGSFLKYYFSCKYLKN